MLVLAALQSWRGGSPFHGRRYDAAGAPVERLCWCWQLFKAGAVVVPSMAGAMMKQARPLSGCAGAGAVVVPSMAGGGSSPKLARW